MLVWTLVLTVVGFNGETSRISARFNSAEACAHRGENVSVALVPSVQSTDFICFKEHVK